MPRFFHHALLLQARLDLNMTQEQAASAVGVDVRTYRRYESGAVNDARGGFSVRHPTRRRMLERLAAEFGLSEEDLLAEALPAALPSPPAASEPEPTPREAPPPEETARGLRPHFAHTRQRARHFELPRDRLGGHVQSDHLPASRSTRGRLGCGQRGISHRHAACIRPARVWHGLCHGWHLRGFLVRSHTATQDKHQHTGRCHEHRAPRRRSSEYERVRHRESDGVEVGWR